MKQLAHFPIKHFFADNGICLAWSQLAEMKTPPVVTTDFIYLRLIGDRSIQEKDFGRIQIDRVREMQKWAGSINKTVQEDDERIRLAIVTANNHYAGFGPGTVNIFRNMVGRRTVATYYLSVVCPEII